MCQTALIFLNLNYSQKNWTRDILNYNMCEIVLNNYKYIFWYKCFKIRKENNLNYINYKNVLIPPFCILPTNFYNPSINIGSISFFSSSDTHQSHHLFGCHATGINSSINFFKCFTFFKFNMPKQKSDMINSIRIISINIIIAKVNAIKIYIKNTNFIEIKYNITKIFIKIEYIFICIQSSKKLFNHFTCNKPIRNKF